MDTAQNAGNERRNTSSKVTLKRLNADKHLLQQKDCTYERRDISYFRRAIGVRDIARLHRARQGHAIQARRQRLWDIGELA